MGGQGMLAIATMGAGPAIVLAPAVAVAVIAGGAVVGGIAGNTLAGTRPDADLCAYSSAGSDLQLWLKQYR